MLDLTDIQSGWVYSFVTGGITLAMVVLGGYSDKIGVRMSLDSFLCSNSLWKNFDFHCRIQFHLQMDF